MSSGDGSALVDVRAARAALQAASGREKIDLLLSGPDPEALVQAIPEHELYLAVLDAGPDDAAEVVALASPEQFRHFVDLGAWPRRDEGPDPRAVLRWLHLAREGGGHSERARRHYLGKLSALDPEIRSLVLRKAVRVHDLQEEAEPAVVDAGRTFRTPEGRYVVEFLPGAGEFGVLKQLLEDLYAEDVLGTTRLFESLRWEVPTELEEAARRWRDGRLRDLGFPELDEALAFYARPRETATLTPTSTATPTELVSSTPNLLERAVQRLDGLDRDRAEDGLVYALNAALVASGVSLDEADEVRATLADARATLSLGLEMLSGGDEQAAARALAERPVRDVFQAGLVEPYRLQARARRIAASARLPQARTATLLEPPLSGLSEALQRKRPLWVDPREPRRLRALATRAQVAEAERLLDEAEAVVGILESLGAGPSALGPRAVAAGLAPTAVRASDVLRALTLQRLRGDAELRLGEEVRAPPEGFPQKLDELLQSATRGVSFPEAGRAAGRLREQVLKSFR